MVLVIALTGKGRSFSGVGKGASTLPRPVQSVTPIRTAIGWSSAIVARDPMATSGGVWSSNTLERALGAPDEFMCQAGLLIPHEVVCDSADLSGGARAPPLAHVMYKHVCGHDMHVTTADLIAGRGKVALHAQHRTTPIMQQKRISRTRRRTRRFKAG